MSFISETVDYLAHRYGLNLTNVKILFPGKRAQLYFKQEIVSRLDGEQSVWQPDFVSIDMLMQSISGIRPADRLSLLAELYLVYSKYHKESFDSFYYWGDMLLSDFDAIDNYMVDARRLFINIDDIKSIDATFDYLTDQQRDIISRFWSAFSKDKNYSTEQTKFLTIWNTLADIYEQYNLRLDQIGYGYKGRIYRRAAENMLSSDAEKRYSTLLSDDFAIVGFNALSAAEDILFRFLRDNTITHFLWDYDDFYVGNKGHEASLFIRENIKKFPEANSSIFRDNFLKHKQIRVVNSPSDATQCKYVWQYLRELAQHSDLKGEKLGRDTVIVLTNESLLLPVLYSIPPQVEVFNVTSGYDLSLTSAYTLVEYLISLQNNKRINSSGFVEFYHKDVMGILSNPFIDFLLSGSGKKSFSVIVDTIIREEMAYIQASWIAENNPSLSKIFCTVDTPRRFAEYIISLFSDIIENISDEELFAAESVEFASRVIECSKSLLLVTERCGIDVGGRVFLSALRKYLKSEKISFEGEPLVGVQVMGILETRNIDFKNVLILSVNEDNFPGNLAGNSFIPANLRYGYGLPTINDREAMYSYYFYRLLQRADRVDIAYVSSTEGMKNGEPSRFIYQLMYESGHKIEDVTLSVDVDIPVSKELCVSKESHVAEILQQYLCGRKKLSPSGIYIYVECPLKFYYKYVESIKEESEISEDMDHAQFGNIMHRVLEGVYGKYENMTITPALLQRELDKGDDHFVSLVRQAMKEEVGDCENILSEDDGNKIYFISEYVKNIIGYDISQGDDFIFTGKEKNVECGFCLLDKESSIITIKGFVDRVDVLKSGLYRIIDYKSGKPVLKISCIDAIFDSDKEVDKSAFQALLYSLIWKEGGYGGDSVPALYFARSMGRGDYSYNIVIGKEPLFRFSDIEDQFKSALQSKMRELFNRDIPFTSTKESGKCSFCNYKKLCNKQ